MEINNHETYLFHQTPIELAQVLINSLDIQPSDILYEPFKGEGAVYNNFPTSNVKNWSELTQGRDYKDYTGTYDWVITNPPFRLETNNTRVNAFWFLLDYFSQRARKGIAFLGNDKVFSSLTPKRMETLKQRGWYLTTLTLCNVKKWRGRYYFFVLEKKESHLFKYLLDSY